MPQTIAVFVDALSDTHVTPELTPTIWQWRQDGGYAELDPLFAFKGVGVSMFTGFPPSETGIWADFKLRQPGDRARDGSHVYKVIHSLPDGLPRRLLTTLYERVLEDAHVTAHRIPPTIRPLLEPAVHTALESPGEIGGFPTMFTQLRDEGTWVSTIGLDGGPQDLFHRLVPKLHRFPHDFVMLKISSLDALGHQYGPKSEVTLRAVRRIDKLLSRLRTSAEDSRIIIFSDHGMTPTVGHLDIQSRIEQELPDIRIGEDFVPYYNSTCAAFRWDDDATREKVKNVLSEEAHLRFLDAKDLEHLAVDGICPSYADDIAATDAGFVIAPDYYRLDAPAGMHGFAALETERAVVATPSAELRPEGKMWDLAATMLDLSGLAVQNGMTGRSLLA